MRRLILILGLSLVACDSRDLGTLIEPAPLCPGAPGCPMVCATPPCEPLPPPPVCDASQPGLRCGVGVCAVQVPACVGEAENTCVPGPSSDERCNDFDDDCDGTVDEGCDDDGDLYCDAEMEVEGSPLICPKGGSSRLDCDDDDPARHPARAEICDDAIDNNCDGLVDYLDFEGCTHITASFEDEDGLRVIDHGTTARIRAVITPPSMELSRQWQVARAWPDDHCRVEDVSIQTPVETAVATQRQVGIVDDPSKLDCEYLLELRIEGIVADVIRIKMRNARPIVGAITGALFDENTLVLVVAEGTNPLLTATPPEDSDAPVTLRWDGADADLLDCAAPCEANAVRFATPPAVGTYRLRVRAADSFDGVFRNRAVRVQVLPCVWARPGGSGMGDGPAVSAAIGNLGTAVRTASAALSNVCIAGTGTFRPGSLLQLPTSVGLLGGFNGAGAPNNNRANLAFGTNGRLRFAAGHRGLVRRVTLRSGPRSPMVEVTDASPIFEGVNFEVGEGAGQVALQVRSQASTTDVRLRSCLVRFADAQQDAVGLFVEALGSARAILRTNGTTEVSVLNCRGACEGVRGHGRVDLRLSGRVIDVQALGAGSVAHAISLSAGGGQRPTASIVGHSKISAHTTAADPADETVAIDLFETDGVNIANNIQVGARTEGSGRYLSAGIADGAVSSDARVRRGASTNLNITENRRIAAGRWTAAWQVDGCDSPDAPPDGVEGTEVGAGILLVGTDTATISGNGNNAGRDNAIFGAASSELWRASGGRRLGPAVPGVWTIDTQDVRILHNQIRSGVLVQVPGCAPDVQPHAEVLRDGLMASPQGALPSTGLLVEGNGLVTGRSGPLTAAPNADLGSSRGLSLLGGGRVRVVNNYIAMTRGAQLVGVFSAQAQDLVLANNTIEVDLLAAQMQPVVAQRGVVLQQPLVGAVQLFNTIVLVRDAADLAPDPTAIALQGPESAQGFGRFEHNLLFVEAAQREAGGAYVLLDGGSQVQAEDFMGFEAMVNGQNTLLLPPLFQAHSLEHRRSITRLTERSPAVNAGTSLGAPGADLFGTARQDGAVDIGHHERAP